MTGKPDWKISALNIGTNHYAKSPANPKGEGGNLPPRLLSPKTVAPLRVKFRGIKQGGYPENPGIPAKIYKI